MKFNAILIDEKDNVATVLKDIQRGDKVIYTANDKEICITAKNNIPFGHKIATQYISEGEKVIKYGETIGIASRNIAKGEHVHIHNLKSIRGRV